MQAINNRVEAWPKDGLESVSRCPVCNSDKRELLYDRLTDRVFFCAPGEWSLYKCCNCGCGYLYQFSWLVH